jgi:hypothetical protein
MLSEGSESGGVRRFVQLTKPFRVALHDWAHRCAGGALSRNDAAMLADEMFVAVAGMIVASPASYRWSEIRRGAYEVQLTEGCMGIFEIIVHKHRWRRWKTVAIEYRFIELKIVERRDAH